MITSLILLANIYLFPMQPQSAGSGTAKFIPISEKSFEKELSHFYKEGYTLKEFSSPADLAESGQGSKIFFLFSPDGLPASVIKCIPLSTDFSLYHTEVKTLLELDDGNYLHPIRLTGIGEIQVNDNFIKHKNNKTFVFG